MSKQIEVAQHLDLSDRQVRDLTKRGVLPPSTGPGGMSLDDCRVAYIRYLRGVKRGQVKDSEEPTDAEDVEKKIEEEKLRKLKRENDLAEGLVAPVDLLQSAFENVTSQMVPILDSMPLEMKRMNPRLTGHDIQVVKKAVARCRNAMADIRVIKVDE